MDFFKKSLIPLASFLVAGIMMLVWFRDIHANETERPGSYPTPFLTAIKSVHVVACGYDFEYYSHKESGHAEIDSRSVDTYNPYPAAFGPENVFALIKKTIREFQRKAGVPLLEDGAFHVEACGYPKTLRDALLDTDALTIFIDMHFIDMEKSQVAIVQVFPHRPGAADAFLKNSGEVVLPLTSRPIPWDASADEVSSQISKFFDSKLLGYFVRVVVDMDGADFS